MILVMILVVAWLAILGPSLVRRWSGAGEGVDSISHFHRQLRVLEHSRGTPIVPPAFRLRSLAEPSATNGTRIAAESVLQRGSTARPVLTVVGAKDLPRPALAFLGADPGGRSLDSERPIDMPRPVVGPRRPQSSGHGSRPRTPRSVDTDARLTALRRRRDTLAVLVLAFTLTLVIGFIPGAGIAWVLTAISGALTAAYVALLIRLRAMDAERERKLRSLSPHTLPPVVGRAGRDEYDAEEALRFADSRYDHPARRAAAF